MGEEMFACATLPSFQQRDMSLVSDMAKRNSTEASSYWLVVSTPVSSQVARCVH